MAEKKLPTCLCKTCKRSSHFKNQCVFEEPQKMAFCPTYMPYRKATIK